MASSNAASAVAAEEVAGLDRVLTRLAMTGDDKLEKVLQKLIPVVIGQLKSPHPAVFNKVREILSHVNKRLKGLPSMQLPLADLVAMYKGDPPPGTAVAQHGMVRNFSLVYAEMAAERASGPDRLAVLPSLLAGLSKRLPDHQAIVLRIASGALEAQPSQPVGGAGVISGLGGGVPAASAAASHADGAPEPALVVVSAAEAALHAKFPYLAEKEDRDVFLSYGLKLMLYTPRTTRAPNTPLAAGQAAAGLGSGGSSAIAAAVSPPLPPLPGLSVADMKQLEAKGALTQDQAVRRKLGFLNLLAVAGLGGPLVSVGDVLPHLLVGSVDSADQVARRSEELLKRSAALDPSRPAANLEDPKLIRQLLQLFHGGAVQLYFNSETTGSSGGIGVGPAPAALSLQDERAASPAGPALRSRLAGLFCRSVAFANTFPASLLTIQECVMPPQASGGIAITAASWGGGGSSPVTGVFARLRQQGLELCVWVFKHAARHQLKSMAPVVLQGLLDTLDGSAPSTPGGPVDSSTMTLRGFAYQAIGSLAQRVPELLQPRIDIARRFFTALSDEPPGVRAAVQEATGALSRAFIQATPGPGTAADAAHELYGGRTAEMDELLLESVRSHKDAVRLCAVQWACRLFPFNHVPARWVCVLGAGDDKHVVREEAARGLKPPADYKMEPVRAQSDATTPASAAATALASSGGGGSEPPAAAASTGQLPPLYDVLRYVRRRLPRIRHPVDPLAALPLPPRSCLALLALLRACRRVRTQHCGTGDSGQAAAAISSAALIVGGTDAMEVDAVAVPSGMTGSDAMEAEGPAADLNLNSNRQLDADPLREDEGALMSAYACALEAGLSRVQGSNEVAAAALEALLEAVAEDSSGALARSYISRASWLRSFLSNTDICARVAAAKLLGSHVAPAMEPGAAADLLDALCSQVSPLLGRPGLAGEISTAAGASTGGAAAPASCSGSGPVPGAVKQEEAEGCLLAVGLILGAAASGNPTLDPAATAAAVGTLVGVLGGSSSGSSATSASAPAPAVAPSQTLQTPAVVSILRAAAALALSYACSSGITPALLLAASPLAADDGSGMLVDKPAAAEASGSSAAGGTTVVAELALSHRPNRLVLDVVVESVSDLVQDKDAKVAARAATAAGFLAGGWGGAWEPEVKEEGEGFSERLLRALFGAATNKSEDVQFAVGEALAWAFGGLSVTPTRVLRDNFTTLADDLTAAAAVVADRTAGGSATTADVEMLDGQAVGDVPDVQVLEGRAARVFGRLRERILDRLLEELVVSPKSEVRCAGAVWLVSLLGYCGRAEVLRGSALPKIQAALSGLLGDSNELTQEMASRGVSLVYRLGDALVREQLVGSLVAVLQGAGGGGAGRQVKLTADTQVFEEGALGAAPAGGGGKGGGSTGNGGNTSGGGLSTYKELCALATDLGQPDLIYKFMDLANHAAALNSRRGAAFGFAGIARLAARGGGTPGEALAKHLEALVPKLYRYTHDPNPKVAEAMMAIWRSLVDEPRVTLDRHFPAIMTDLLKEMGGRLWRNRQAACSALGDLLQGRRWLELSPYMSQILVMTFRAMDDIKDSVRQVALSLARTVRGLTLRLADPAHTPAKECCSAVAVVVPVLLEQGLLSTVSEVRALAVDVLGQVARSCPAPALRPLLPSLVPALLEALSALEDVRLNYVEQHAERWGLDSERLDGARVAAARASPLGDTLDLAARLVDGPSLEQLVPALVGTVKRGVGLNTKVGTARFIRNLASRPGAAIAAVSSASASESTAAVAASSGSGGISAVASEPLLRAHASPLLRVLVGAVRSERSSTVRRSYAVAAAQVVRHAGEKRMDKFVAEAVSSYSEPGDVESRLAGGLLLRELLRAAPEKFRMYDASVLPAAFGAKMDEDKDVAAVWSEVWEEGVSSEPAALRLYGKEICTTLCEMLAGQQWGRKKAASEATIKLSEIAPDALGDHGRRLAAALLSELGAGRLWEGKEAVLGALAALVAANPRVMEVEPGHDRVVDALMSAVGRKKTSYRTAALAALEIVLRALPSSHYERVSPPLLAAVLRHCDTGAAASDAAATHGTSTMTPAAADDDSSEQPLPPSECLSCLSTAFARLGDTTIVTAGVAAAASSEAKVATVVSEQGGVLAAALRRVLSAQLPWQPKLASATAVQVLAQRCKASGMDPASSAHLLGPLASGLLQSAQDHKVQQLRLAALGALSALVDAAAPAVPSTGCISIPTPSLPGSAAAQPTVTVQDRAVGFSEVDRRELLPSLVSGLQQLADADKSAAVVAAALGVKAALEPLLMAPTTDFVPDVMMTL